MATQQNRGRAARIATAAAVAVLAVLVGAGGAHAEASYKVRRGDTLSGIASKHGCSVDAISAANRIKGDLIRIGQDLVIPDGCGGGGGGGGDTITHVVIAGDTLSEIAENYGVTIDHIKSMNRSLRGRGAIIRVGQRLTLRPTKRGRERHKVVYKIEAGDTLGGIAAKYGLSVGDIERMNPRKRANALRIGDSLTLWIEGPENPSASVGRPQAGRLVDGEQLPNGPSWYRRRPHRAWGTNETIRLLTEAFHAVRRKHPKCHDIAVGDISAKEGGRLAGHKSHQNGRDVDLGFYFEGQPRSGPKAFLSANSVRLDYEATWTLLTELAGDSPSRSRVEYMFIDYGVQKKIYQWAQKKGVSKRTLDWMFQYPRGSRAMHGMIRHEPGHAHHIHVRFKCARGDTDCH